MTAIRRTGRPLQALAVLAALLIGWIAGRWPLLQRDVEAAVASAEREQALAALPMRAPAVRQAVTSGPAFTSPLQEITLNDVVIPANAGTHLLQPPEMGSRVRGNDGLVRHYRVTPDAKTAPEAQAAKTAPEVQVVVAVAPSPTGSISDCKRAPATTRSSAFDLATRAYAALAAGDRRSAVLDFDAALAADSADPQAPAWVLARRALNRRWSGSAYVFARADSPGVVRVDPGGAPLLGGSQSGMALALTPDPLARRPLDLIMRVTGGTSLDQRQAEAATGLRWRLAPALSLSAERLIALGAGGRHDWTLRLAGGRTARIGPVVVDGYGEAGIVGIAHPLLFAAAQARVGYPVAVGPALTLSPGGGVWAGVQRERIAATDRVDVGPSLRLHWARAALPVDVAVDYRVRVAGNAAPGTGAALTLGTGF